VAAIDGKTLRGKTLRGTKPDQERGGRLACRLGLCARGWSRALAARAVESKGNEITAIPELLARLALEGAVVTIDAIGTQEAIARTIIAKKADYLLALKENQGSLYADVADFFADPALASACGEWRRIEAGHGRIEDRLARAADAAWLAERHPRWAGLRSIAAISATRTDKKTARRLDPDAALHLLAAARPGPAARRLPVALERREQLALAARCDFPRRSMSNPQGLCRNQSDQDAPRRSHHPHPRANQNLHQAKTPQSRHQPTVPNHLARMLTIHDLALGQRPGQYDLGISNERIGDVQVAQGDLAGALT
jgi:hypothetical protein